MTNPNGSNKEEEVKAQIFKKVLNKLKEGNHKDTNLDDFEDKLWEHFTLLPTRYAIQVEGDDVEHVLQHQSLLRSLVEDPKKGFVFGVAQLVEPNKHKVTLASTTPQHKLEELVEEVGLMVEQANYFYSTNGHCLNILVVDGWNKGEKELEELLTLKMELKYAEWKKKLSQRKPKISSVLDTPFELLRKHVVVTFSERLYKRLHSLAEKKKSVGSNLIKVASFTQEKRSKIMGKLLFNRPCEFTHCPTFNTKQASLAIARTTATFFVAGCFGLLAVGSDIIPAADEKKKDLGEKGRLVFEMKNLIKGASEMTFAKIKELLESKEKTMKEVVRRVEARHQEAYAQVSARLLILEEDAAKSKRWFGRWR